MIKIVTLEELFDFDSDFHVRRHAEKAQRTNRMILSLIERGLAESAGLIASRAASEGAKALKIIERRGSDDLESFC